MTFAEMNEYETTMKRVYPSKYKGKYFDKFNMVWKDILKQTNFPIIRVEEPKSTSNRKKSKSNSKFKKIRPYVFSRDGYKCVKCGSKSKLHIHHIVHRKDGGSDEINNLQTLCNACHSEERFDEPIYRLMVKNN